MWTVQLHRSRWLRRGRPWEWEGQAGQGVPVVPSVQSRVALQGPETRRGMKSFSFLPYSDLLLGSKSEPFP